MDDLTDQRVSGEPTDYERGNRDGQALNEMQRQQAERGEQILRTRLQEAQARIAQLEGALRELIRLKDGPRDDAYRALKPVAWERARETLPAASSLSGRGEVEGGSRSALPATENRGAPSLPRPDSDEPHPPSQRWECHFCDESEVTPAGSVPPWCSKPRHGKMYRIPSDEKVHRGQPAPRWDVQPLRTLEADVYPTPPTGAPPSDEKHEGGGDEAVNRADL